MPLKMNNLGARPIQLFKVVLLARLYTVSNAGMVNCVGLYLDTADRPIPLSF